MKAIAPENKTLPSLYQEAMLCHHKNPTGFNKPIKANVTAQGENAVCGDEITLELVLEDTSKGRVINDIAFVGDSCAICRASASILCQQVNHLLFNEASDKSAFASAIINANCVEEYQDNSLYQAFAPLSVVHQYPVRKQCALLPWLTLDKLLDSVRKNPHSISHGDIKKSVK